MLDESGAAPHFACFARKPVNLYMNCLASGQTDFPRKSFLLVDTEHKTVDN